MRTRTGDTLSGSARARHEREALARCDNPNTDATHAGGFIIARTVVPTPRTPPTAPDSAWQDVVRAGVLRLPPMVPRNWAMLDGHTYVIELRQGDSYRAS